MLVCVERCNSEFHTLGGRGASVQTTEGGAGRSSCSNRRSRGRVGRGAGVKDAYGSKWGGLLWAEVGSLGWLFHKDHYNPTEPPPVQDFLLLEKSRQAMIEEVGGGSLAFRNMRLPSTDGDDENSCLKVWATYRAKNDRNRMRPSSEGKIQSPHTNPTFG